MRGFTDASQWLKEHPWPNGLSVDETKTKSDRRYFRRCLRVALGVCGSAGAETLDEDEREAAEGFAQDEERRFKWTQELKNEFCEELQKLVALDFLMLNTDRGLDNFVGSNSAALAGLALTSLELSDDPILVSAPNFYQAHLSTSLANPQLYHETHQAL